MTLPTADVFAGRVIDADGRPIAGAKINTVPVEGSLPSGPTDPGPVRAVTAAGGLFRFSAKDLTFTLDRRPTRTRGEGLPIAAADGYGPDWVRDLGPDPGRRLLPYNLGTGPRGPSWTLVPPPRRYPDPRPIARPGGPPSCGCGRQSGRPRRAVEERPKERDGNNFPSFLKYGIKRLDRKPTPRRVAWMPIRRELNG